jgi:Peptidase family S41
MLALSSTAVKLAAAIVFGAICSASVVYADASGPTLSVEDLQTDVSVLEQVYRALHPDLLRYLTPSQLNTAFGELGQELSAAQSTSRALLAFSVFAVKLRCGHTYPNFLNQPKKIQALFESTPRLPFYFRWINKKMIVTRDFTDARALTPGTEVVSVNGVPAHTILSKLMPLARADGSNDAKRIDQLSVSGDSIYEAFDIYYPLIFDQSGDQFALTVRRPFGTVHGKLNVRALTYAQRIAPIAQREEERHQGSKELFEWRDLPSGAAYLKMPNWALYDSQWDWSEWLNVRLDALAARKTPALIIDLRGNEGGLDVGNVILSRLVATDLVLPDAKRLVRYRSVPPALKVYLTTWDKSFEDWGAEATELIKPWPSAPAAHYFSLANEEGTVDGPRVIHAVQPRFEGRVFVLIDASNSSATFQFSSIVQRQHLGTLVGQPTGGNLRGINGGAFFFVNLPRSHVELDLPLIGFFPASREPDRGLTPDMPTSVTAADIARGFDRELDAALRSIGTPR